MNMHFTVAVWYFPAFFKRLEIKNFVLFLVFLGGLGVQTDKSAISLLVSCMFFDPVVNTPSLPLFFVLSVSIRLAS